MNKNLLIKSLLLSFLLSTTASHSNSASDKFIPFLKIVAITGLGNLAIEKLTTSMAIQVFKDFCEKKSKKEIEDMRKYMKNTKTNKGTKNPFKLYKELGLKFSCATILYYMLPIVLAQAVISKVELEKKLSVLGSGLGFVLGKTAGILLYQQKYLSKTFVTSMPVTTIAVLAATLANVGVKMGTLAAIIVFSTDVILKNQ